MPQCATCGNQYDKAFRIEMAGTSSWFDSFECAIEAMAPRCGHCGCRVMGHGVEEGDVIYCCAHCAGENGATAVRDRA